VIRNLESKDIVIEDIKRDIKEILAAKRAANPDVFLSFNEYKKVDFLAREFQYSLEQAAGKAQVDINRVPVQSLRPFWGKFITIFKRAIRKSTYWLYQPLFTHISSFNTTVSGLLGELVQKLEMIWKENDQRLQKINQYLEQRSQEDTTNLKQLSTEMDAKLNQTFVSAATDKAEVQREITEVRHCVQDLSGKLSNFQKTIDDYRLEAAFLRAKLALVLQYKQTGKLPGENVEQPVIGQKNVSFENDAWLYNVFEQNFRGPENLIKERQRAYLPDVQNAFAAHGGYVLDIGAGRGEFLELCREVGISAKGVDTNELMVGHCQEKNLDVKKADGTDYLQTIPDESLCALTAFQVIEHITPDQLWKLVQAALVKIKPGGLIVLETVNPESFYSFKNFYLDLTHQKPIPPATLHFLLEAAGFRKVEVRFSSPLPKNVQLNGDDEYTRKLNEILFGSQDYAVLGWR
jgi:O-antigen chain-terminating methyltransferase